MLYSSLSTLPLRLQEGVQGLWRGTVPGLLLTVPYTAVQFVALHQVKDAASYYGLTGVLRLWGQTLGSLVR